MRILLVSETYLDLYVPILQEFKKQGHEVVFIPGDTLPSDTHRVEMNPINRCYKQIYNYIFDVYTNYWKAKFNEIPELNQKFDYYISPAISYKDYSVTGLRYLYNNKIFTEAKLDENYIKDLKNVLNSDSLADDMKLQLMDDIYYDKICLKEEGKTKESIKLTKEMLSAFMKNKAYSYSKPNSTISYAKDKFNLGYNLFTHANIYDNYKVLSTDDKLKIAQNLKKQAKNLQINTLEPGIDIQIHYINDIYSEELYLRSKLFFEKHASNASIDDFEKFADNILNGYNEAIEHFIKGDIIFQTSDEKALADNFEIFRIQSHYIIMQKQIHYLSIRDTKSLKRLDNIIDKIEEFNQKHFNTGENKYYKKSRKTDSNGSKFNFNDFFNDTTKKAKSTLAEFLKKDDALKEFAEIVESDKLDKTVIKNIKRKFAVKYHPDKAKDDSQRAEYTKIFQEINNAIETLEKTLK